MSNTLCDFGCGRIATNVLKSGKQVCAASVNSCPVMRERNGAGKRGKNPFADRPHPRGMTGKVPWNRGRRYEETYDLETVRRVREAAARGGSRRLGERRISAEIEAGRREKLSTVARARGLGGYQRGSGRGKKGRYRGHWCDSTYELVFVVWALDHDIPFIRNLELFPYEYQGRLFYWMPDFVLADGTYIEIKGYLTEQARAKFEYFLRPLQVFARADLGRMFDYVHEKYGKNLPALYE